MYHVGIDAHLRQSTYCVLDRDGKKLMSRTVRGPQRKLLKALGEIKEPFEACFEASCGYGHLYDELGKMALRVQVAHPGALRLIFRSRQKNDRMDAERLSKLLFLDEVPPVHVPSARVRTWRATISLRSKVVMRRTATKCRIRALLRSEGIEAPRSLWSKAGLKWLKDLAWSSDFSAVSRDLLVEELESVAGALRRLEKALDGEARANPGVVLLRTIPGVGARTAEAVVAYMDEPHRFGRSDRVGAYFGLVPCLDSSAGKDRYGHITRQGPSVVRRLLVEAAWQSVRRSRRMKAFYDRVRRDDPQRSKKAIVAVAHKLVRCMHAMLRRNTPWQEDLKRTNTWHVEAAEPAA
jgi:transposase